MRTHSDHQHDTGGSAAPGWTSVSWSTAASATLHCLTGCAIGEVLGMIVGTALGLHNAATVVLSIVLAFVFGYGLTMRGVLRAGVDVPRDLSVAGFDDTRFARLSAVDLTTASQDTEALGRQAVEAAVRRIEDPDLPPRLVTVEPRLVERSSTAPPPS